MNNNTLYNQNNFGGKTPLQKAKEEHPDWYIKSRGDEKQMTKVYRYDGAEANQKVFNAGTPYESKAPLPEIEPPMVDIAIPQGLQGKYEDKIIEIPNTNGRKESRKEQRERNIKNLLSSTVPLERFGHANMFLDKVQEDDQIELMLRPNINFIESFADMYIGVQDEINQAILRGDNVVHIYDDDKERRDIALEEGLKRLNLLKVADRERNILQNSATVNYILGDVMTNRVNAQGANAYTVLLNAGLLTQAEAETLQAMNNDGVKLPYLSAVSLTFIDLMNEIIYGLSYKWQKANEALAKYDGMEYLAAKTMRATYNARDKVEAENFLEQVWKESGLIPADYDYSKMKMSTQRYKDIAGNMEDVNWGGPTPQSLNSPLVPNQNLSSGVTTFTLDERKAMSGMSAQERANFMGAKMRAENEGRIFNYDPNAITNSMITGPNPSTNMDVTHPNTVQPVAPNNNGPVNTSGLLRGTSINNKNIGGNTRMNNVRPNAAIGRVPLRRTANQNMQNNGQYIGTNPMAQRGNSPQPMNGAVQGQGTPLFNNNAQPQMQQQVVQQNEVMGNYNQQPQVTQQQYVAPQPVQQVQLVRGTDGNLYVQNPDGSYRLYQQPQAQCQVVQQVPANTAPVNNNDTMAAYYNNWNTLAQTQNVANVNGYDPSKNPFLRDQNDQTNNGLNNTVANVPQYNNQVQNAGLLNTGELHLGSTNNQAVNQQQTQVQPQAQRVITINGAGDIGALNSIYTQPAPQQVVQQAQYNQQQYVAPQPVQPQMQQQAVPQTVQGQDGNWYTKDQNGNWVLVAYGNNTQATGMGVATSYNQF